MKEDFEDTKGVIRIRKLMKDRNLGEIEIEYCLK
jgi:hypothetical protein